MAGRKRKLGPGRGSERWPEEERTRALELAAEKGPVAAARETGIPLGTIRAWRSKAGGAPPRKPEARASWAERKQEGAVETWQEARSALSLVRERLASGDERKAKDAALTMAILIDKSSVLEEASALAGERDLKLQQDQADAIAEALVAIFADLGIPRSGAEIRAVVAHHLRKLSDPDAPDGPAPRREEARAAVRERFRAEWDRELQRIQPIAALPPGKPEKSKKPEPKTEEPRKREKPKPEKEPETKETIEGNGKPLPQSDLHWKEEAWTPNR